jgi:hypothetical protein
MGPTVSTGRGPDLKQERNYRRPAKCPNFIVGKLFAVNTVFSLSDKFS